MYRACTLSLHKSCRACSYCLEYVLSVYECVCFAYFSFLFPPYPAIFDYSIFYFPYLLFTVMYWTDLSGHWILLVYGHFSHGRKWKPFGAFRGMEVPYLWGIIFGWLFNFSGWGCFSVGVCGVQILDLLSLGLFFFPSSAGSSVSLCLADFMWVIVLHRRVA